MKRFTEANVINEPPVDIWGRKIETGGYALSSVGDKYIYKVGQVTVYGDPASPAGFEFIGATGSPHGAGTHVQWEVVARPGEKPPASYKEIRRDSRGAPILGRFFNERPHQQPSTACGAR